MAIVDSKRQPDRCIEYEGSGVLRDVTPDAAAAKVVLCCQRKILANHVGRKASPDQAGNANRVPVISSRAPNTPRNSKQHSSDKTWDDSLGQLESYLD